MRHLKSLLLVIVSYSLALGTPASAKADADGFSVMKDYVNGTGKKNFQSLFSKMEKDLPTNYYEQGLKLLKGSNGKAWFQAAKVAPNYSYLRFNNSKIFIRVTTEKDKTVFYANGIRINEEDFRNIATVQNKLAVAFVVGLPSKKVSFWDMLNVSEAFAAGKFEKESEVGGSEPANDVSIVGPATGQTECDQIRSAYVQMVQAGQTENAQILAQKMKEENCEGAGAVVANTPAATAGGSKLGMYLFIGAAILMLLLFSKKKKKKPATPGEVPEDTKGVGRGDGEGGGGGVNCGGEGAQCGGKTPTPSPSPTPIPIPIPSPDPGTPTPPPSGGVSTDPNFYNESFGRVPVSGKTKQQNK